MKCSASAAQGHLRLVLADEWLDGLTGEFSEGRVAADEMRVAVFYEEIAGHLLEHASREFWAVVPACESIAPAKAAGAQLYPIGNHDNSEATSGRTRPWLLVLHAHKGRLQLNVT